MNNKGLVLWTLGGAGVFLLYAAYKNQSPTGLLVNHLTNSSGTVAPISTSPQPVPDSSAPGGSNYKGSTSDPGSAASPDDPYYATQAPGENGPAAYITGHGYVGMDGTYYATDSAGNPVTALPAAYQSSPQLHINTVA